MVRYCVTWCERERQFLGTCAEWPYLSHYDATRRGAMAGIKRLVRFACAP